MVEQKTSPNGAGNPPANPSSRARQHRLLEIRENLPARTTAKTATPAVAGSLEGEAKPNSQGGELNDFIRQLVDRREQRRHQLEIIQDFFENPVEFGIEADVIPSGTPLEEIRERKKELRYRIDLLRSVLEALEGEHKLLTHAEMSALRPQSDPVE
jgi:hypothetical protein